MELRDRAIFDIAAVRDITGEFLAALARVRLVGRPDSVAAAEAIRSLLQTLVTRIPTKERRTIYTLRSARSKQKDDLTRQVRAFSKCMEALGDAHSQFTSTIHEDRIRRTHSWQAWRRAGRQGKSASELLEETPVQAIGA